MGHLQFICFYWWQSRSSFFFSNHFIMFGFGYAWDAILVFIEIDLLLVNFGLAGNDSCKSLSGTGPRRWNQIKNIHKKTLQISMPRYKPDNLHNLQIWNCFCA